MTTMTAPVAERSMPLGAKPGLQLVTPEDAQRLLATRAINRAPKERLVRYLTRQIELGRWRPTADTLGVNEEGQLVDGQHRCLAISAAGKPVEIEIRFIRSEDALAVDTGASRSAGDLFAIRNIDHAKTTAACVRAVIAFRYAVGRESFSGEPGRVLSNEELWEIVKADPGFIVAAGIGTELRQMTPFLAQGQLAALYYLFAEAADGATARRFLDDVAQDRDPSDDSLTHAARRWLLKAEAAKRKPTRAQAFVVMIGAWNRWLRGERSSRVQVPKKTIWPVASPRNSGATEDDA